MSLDDIIKDSAPNLIYTGTFNPEALLHAIAQVESSHGEHALASRHERGYCYGSVLYNGPNGADLREQSQKWGCLAHSSFGTFQIMFIVAHEMGYVGDPIGLRDDLISLPYVVRFINRRILAKHPRIAVESFADAYNSGRPDDDRVPTEYIDQFVKAYTKWVMKLDPPEVLHA